MPGPRRGLLVHRKVISIFAVAEQAAKTATAVALVEYA
jgi:hypothetical protein